jgi:hypothetical protein
MCVGPATHRDRLIFLTGLCALATSLGAAEEPFLRQRPQPWLRQDQPILSADETAQAWAKVVLYSPHVVRVKGAYRMWYVGTATASRSVDMSVGCAVSADGVHWTEHKANPILTPADLPWGSFWQTPFVLYDRDTDTYEMWFTSLSDIETNDEGRLTSGVQQLGYATSRDGIRWNIRPEPIFEYGRSPCVIKEAAGQYRMWMNSGPKRDGRRSGLLGNIYEFASVDGIEWTQASQPSIQPSGRLRSVVYPYVIRHDARYYMWYGGHVAEGHFELFCAESADGTDWTIDHERSAFPAARKTSRFDGRYTSTPCVLVEGDRLLLYYSARDLTNEYIDGNGKRRRDGSGVYRHIGIATSR